MWEFRPQLNMCIGSKLGTYANMFIALPILFYSPVRILFCTGRYFCLGSHNGVGERMVIIVVMVLYGSVVLNNFYT